MPHDCILLKTSVCSRCPALVANRHRIVHGYGDPQARVMIVGEAPGYLGRRPHGCALYRRPLGPARAGAADRAGLVGGKRPAVELPRCTAFF